MEGRFNETRASYGCGPEGSRQRLSIPPLRDSVLTAGGIETPQPLRMVFAPCANPRPNCRLKRTAYETTAPSGSPPVRPFLLKLDSYCLPQFRLPYFVYIHL